MRLSRSATIIESADRYLSSMLSPRLKNYSAVTCMIVYLELTASITHRSGFVTTIDDFAKDGGEDFFTKRHCVQIMNLHGWIGRMQSILVKGSSQPSAIFSTIIYRNQTNRHFTKDRLKGLLIPPPPLISLEAEILL